MVLLSGCPSQSDGNTESSPAGTPFETPTQTSATTPDVTPTDTATPSAALFELRDLQYPETVIVGATPEIRVEVENVGRSTGAEVVTLFWAGSAMGKTVELPPDTRETITFTPDPVRNPGPVTFRIVDQSDSSLRGEIQVSGLDRHYVSPDGDDDNRGTQRNPLATIQHAFDRAQPGETVHVLPGEYFQDFEPVRDGKPGAPIEITGPPDAVIHGAGSRSDGIVCFNTHSHIHITGLTFDGLWRPEQPDNPQSYRTYLIWTRAKTSEYLTDVKIKPHAVGNARYSFIDFNMTNNVEVGEFEIIGPAGASYVVGDAENHEGEIVYVGSPPTEAKSLQQDGILEGADTSHEYHTHHIDNSAGYGHSELVNTKPGTYAVTVEYCTDGGNGYDTDQSTNASIALQGHSNTVRWNDLQGGTLPDDAVGPTHGIKIDANVPIYC
jgi:hypothetical protein